jgi:hypothetical protein
MEDRENSYEKENIWVIEYDIVEEKIFFKYHNIFIL